MERPNDLFLFRLTRLAATAGRPLTRLCEGRYGITRREWRLIVVLAQDGPQLSTELARRASIPPERTSRTVTELVNNGLATRATRSNDRRCVEIALTEAGRHVFTSLYPVVQQINAELLSTFSAIERQEIERLFMKLANVADKLPELLPDMPAVNRRRMRR